jgi:GxxExxY protein
MNINELTEIVIGLAIKVHKTLGPGFLESVYQAALAYELEKAGIPFESEKGLPVA